MNSLIFIVIITTSIWVYFDAKTIGVKKGQIKGLFGTGPVGWFIICLLLWIIGFPAYLMKRNELKRIAINASTTEPNLEKKSSAPSLLMILFVVLLGYLIATNQSSISQFISNTGLFGRSKEYVQSNTVEMVNKKLIEDKENYRCSSVLLVKQENGNYEGIVKFDNGNQGTIKVFIDKDAIYCKWQANPLYQPANQADLQQIESAASDESIDNPSADTSSTTLPKVVIDYITDVANKYSCSEYKGGRELVVGDLDSDGVSDLAIEYTLEGCGGGGNNFTRMASVFLNKNGNYVHIADTVEYDKLSLQRMTIKSMAYGKVIFNVECNSYYHEESECDSLLSAGESSWLVLR